MSLDTKSICLHKQLIPLLLEVCKLFSCSSKPIHALWASKRRPFGLQKVPFKTPTNTLLMSYLAPFETLFRNFFIARGLQR